MRSAGTTGFRPFHETNSSECRIRCTTQVWMIVSGKTALIASGNPFRPSTTAMRMVLLHLMAGSKEDTETVRAFFQDMRGRGLGAPLRGDYQESCVRGRL